MGKYFVAEHIFKVWNNVTVDFALEAEQNSLTCILGPSGSGKSTILNIIAGLEKNDDDKIKITLDGSEIQNLPPSKRNIGMVFQSGALFNHLNVVDNVSYGLISKGVSKKDARKQASELLKEFELDGFDTRNVTTLSGGEKQRVALARTLIVKPKLVLFDEPLSALDTSLRRKLAAQIKDWHKSLGFTGIMVTHDEDEAEIVGDNVVRLTQGT